MVGRYEVGVPRQTAAPECRRIGDMPGSQKDIALLGMLLKLNGHGITEQDSDNLYARVARGQKATLMESSLEPDLYDYEPVMITISCPADSVKRCGKLCIQNVLQSTTPKHAKDAEPEVGGTTTSVPQHAKPEQPKLALPPAFRNLCTGFGAGESKPPLKRKY